MHRPTQTQQDRQQVGDHQPAEILERGDDHHSREEGKGEGIEVEGHGLPHLPLPERQRLHRASMIERERVRRSAEDGRSGRSIIAFRRLTRAEHAAGRLTKA
jgi:hypothetical protein